MKSEYLELDGIKYYRYPYSKYVDKRNYFKSQGRKSYHRQLWIKHYGNIPKGYLIHHIDGNSLNNDISNLCIVSPKMHGECHSKLAKLDPQKDIYKKSRRWHKSEAGKTHHKEIIKNRIKKEVDCQFCSIKMIKYNYGEQKYTCKSCKNKKAIERNKKKPKIKKEPKNLEEKLCIVCQKLIIQKTKKLKLFCGNACKSKSRVKRFIDNVDRNCEICNTIFSINKYSKTATCSFLCRNEKIRRKLLEVG